MQLVDPEDIPAMERLTQEVLLLREKVASVESQGQEVSGNRRQQVSSWDTGSSATSIPSLIPSVPESRESASPVSNVCNALSLSSLHSSLALTPNSFLLVIPSYSSSPAWLIAKPLPRTRSVY